ncbi:HEPN domain-containing protein [Pseudaminobacter soli (ex Li et al. 2025)]|uniref:Uncharacterized protein n=1 Tax=Pseudaminobacter soli (ex Li et al. 2025) TaxID=1295366 RepID=A0A2P7S9V6_9HYPH|nr:HEPN domain-containing protein [Mesorhizobium soli]PSJ59247.1 hypothetical protein C7I85_16630 [Mesorhizobium soli]
MNLLDNDRFAHAAIVAAGNHKEPFLPARMASIWSGIEALLGLDHELRHRISYLVAILLGTDRADQEARLSRTKKLYDLRSKCVHGAGLKESEGEAALVESLDLLCDLTLHFARRGRLLSLAEQNGFF